MQDVVIESCETGIVVVGGVSLYLRFSGVSPSAYICTVPLAS